MRGRVWFARFIFGLVIATNVSVFAFGRLDVAVVCGLGALLCEQFGRRWLTMPLADVFRWKR